MNILFQFEDYDQEDGSVREALLFAECYKITDKSRIEEIVLNFIRVCNKPGVDDSTADLAATLFLKFCFQRNYFKNINIISHKMDTAFIVEIMVPDGDVFPEHKIKIHKMFTKEHCPICQNDVITVQDSSCERDFYKICVTNGSASGGHYEKYFVHVSCWETFVNKMKKIMTAS